MSVSTKLRFNKSQMVFFVILIIFSASAMREIDSMFVMLSNDIDAPQFMKPVTNSSNADHPPWFSVYQSLFQTVFPAYAVTTPCYTETNAPTQFDTFITNTSTVLLPFALHLCRAGADVRHPAHCSAICQGKQLATCGLMI